MLDIINYASPNYSTRAIGDVLQYIILHFTEVDKQQSLKLLTSEEAQVSCHYLVDENGEILQLVEPKNIAWHAGRSSWEGKEALNKYSIGIELVNNGKGKFAEKQVSALLKLLKLLSVEYSISPYNIIGHSDIAPRRKIDPGPFFPWAMLADNGLGLWYELGDASTSETHYHFGDQGEGVRRLQKELSLFGYTIDLTAIFDQQTNYVIRSFISHFCPHIILDQLGLEHYWQLDSRYFWNAECSQILASLLRRKNSLQ